ncbi:ABC transporter permease [Thermococcus nautili]|uniref:ABC-type multidrug transport system, permease component n=1 Tax=Thermococcus nautili TaxID=195522 RepID=W8NX12_9EURY|nr:ABC transporter permease [Thermococcus nautili]AHL23712.1 ABC-type multidrug transport system, permease component [Thermococcus nautili]
MNSGRVLAVARRSLLELRHDKRLLSYALITPIVLMVLFGLAFGGHVHDVKVVVVNDDGSFGSGFIGNLNASTFSVSRAETLGDALKELRDGRCWAVIYFPENPGEIRVYLDRSNTYIADAVVSGINAALMRTLEENGLRLPVRVSYNAVYGRNTKFMDTFLPGVMSLAVFLISTVLSILSFIGERNLGTLDRALASPLSEGEVVLGYSIASGVIGTIQAAIMLAIAVFGFGVNVEGSLLLAFALVALLAIVGVNLGILLSNLARNEAQAVQFVPMIVVPTFLLSGIFWPVEAIPKYLRPFSYLLPPTYAVDSLRSVMIRGWGLDKIWGDVAVLLGFGVLFLGLAVLNMKRRR